MAAYFQRENARKYKHFGGRAVFHCIVNCSTPFILDTPDESSRAGCVMLGVFYCSEKGQAILRNSFDRLSYGRCRQGCRGSRNEMLSLRKGTPCAWHEQGTYSRYPRPDNIDFLYIPQSITRGLRYFFIRHISICFPIRIQKDT